MAPAPWKLTIEALRAAAKSDGAFEAALYPHLRKVYQGWGDGTWTYRGQKVSAADVRAFVGAMFALSTDPFGGNHDVAPWGQLGDRPSVDYLGLSQLAAAYLLARYALQDDLGGAALGSATRSNLAVALARCASIGAGAAEVQSYAVWSLLAVAAVDLRAPGGGLRGGAHVVYARGPQGPDGGKNWVDPTALAGAPLPPIGACAVTCAKAGCSSRTPGDIIWSPQGGELEIPCSAAEGVDAMQAPIEGLGTVDVSAQTIGGGAALCGLAQQDESSPAFNPELIVLSAYRRPGKGTNGEEYVQQLPVPCLVFGCRTFLATYLEIGNPCGDLHREAPLSPHIMLACSEVALADHRVAVYRRTFVPLDGPAAGYNSNLRACDQWVVSNLKFAVSWATQSLSPAGYPAEVYGAWKGSFRLVGGVPWGAGGYSGSISNDFLALVLGVAAANVDIRSLLGADAQLGLLYWFYANFCDAGTGTSGQGCALCAYCRPPPAPLGPPADHWALPGGGTMLDGLNEYPVCSEQGPSCASCAKPDSELKKVLRLLKGSTFGAVWKQIVAPKPADCLQYARSDHALGLLLKGEL
jgi:hypothetical protein